MMIVPGFSSVISRTTRRLNLSATCFFCCEMSVTSPGAAGWLAPMAPADAGAAKLLRAIDAAANTARYFFIVESPKS